jgi:D-alanine-D-alanine ligase
MAALDPDRYEVVPIGITKDGRWLAGDAMAALSEGAAARPATLLPEPAAGRPTGRGAAGLDRSR